MSEKTIQEFDEDKIRIALDMIAKENGMDEDDCIIELKEEYNIIITEDIAPSWRANAIAIYVREPYTKERYEELQNGSPFVSNVYINKVVSRINNGKIMQYPIHVELYRIDDQITEYLLNDHDINIYEYDDEEIFDKISKLDEYEGAKLQVVREFVADAIKAKLP